MIGQNVFVQEGESSLPSLFGSLRLIILGTADIEEPVLGAGLLVDLTLHVLREELGA